MYIFTESYNCAEVTIQMLMSYVKFHSDKIHVFCSNSDCSQIRSAMDKFAPESSCIEYVVYDNPSIRAKYQSGHSGTADVFAQVIYHHCFFREYMVHIDSDVIFRKESLSILKQKISEGYDLIGPIRNYKNNPQKNSTFSAYPDVISTYIMAVNTAKITQRPIEVLEKMCQGAFNPLGHPTIDFFDPVSFDVIRNGGRVFNDLQIPFGGMNSNAAVKNVAPMVNEDLDFGENLVHFAGVGSGCSFIQHSSSAPASYQKWAIERYQWWKDVVVSRKESSHPVASKLQNVPEFVTLNRAMEELEQLSDVQRAHAIDLTEQPAPKVRKKPGPKLKNKESNNAHGQSL